MEYIKRIAFYLDRRDEVPNQELAGELADNEDCAGIEEIASYLQDKNTSIQSDCIKVLYEIGYLRPDLIDSFVDTFIGLLESKRNRMVWGAMIALSTIAELRAAEIWKHKKLLLATIKAGTVITEVSGIKTLANLIKGNQELYAEIFPILLEYLADCRPVDFATRLDTIMAIVNPADYGKITAINQKKMAELKQSQLKKVIRIEKKYGLV